MTDTDTFSPTPQPPALLSRHIVLAELRQVTPPSPSEPSGLVLFEVPPDTEPGQVTGWVEDEVALTPGVSIDYATWLDAGRPSRVVVQLTPVLDPYDNDPLADPEHD